jgi:hypothetical protein
MVKYVACFIVGILIFVAIPAVVNYTTNQEITGKVLKTERVIDGVGKSSKYIVFCENETFECVDTIWYLKFNSSDIYGGIKEGKTYKFTVVGFRIPLFSWYRNIITAEVTNL